MRRLLLLRHAKAERSQPGGRDHERILSARGREDAATLGVYLARHGLAPGLAVVSTSARTRETWTLAAASFPGIPHATFEERLYDAGTQTLIDVVRETGSEIDTLLLLGHNPGLQELAALLIASGDLEARQKLNEELPTAGLVVIDFALDAWSRLHPHAGRLDRFVSPSMLAAATD